MCHFLLAQALIVIFTAVGRLQWTEVWVYKQRICLYICACVCTKGGYRSSECQGTQKQRINWWCYRNICWKQEFVALLCTPYTKIFYKLALRTQVQICSHNLFLSTSVYSAVVPSEKIFVCFTYHLAIQTNFEAGWNSSANFFPTQGTSFFSQYLIFKQPRSKIATLSGHKECARKAAKAVHQGRYHVRVRKADVWFRLTRLA